MATDAPVEELPEPSDRESIATRESAEPTAEEPPPRRPEDWDPNFHASIAAANNPKATVTDPEGDRFADPLGLLGERNVDGPEPRAADAQLRALTPAEREAISVLGLVAPVTKADVKLRYKILAKMLHPDANGGDKRAEDRLKSVNYAYTTLRDSERLI